MRVAPLFRAFRQHSLGPPTATALDEETMKIGAAMAWINRQGNLDDFPGSRNERLALMTTAVRRGLVAWDRGHDRYKLTQLGKTQVAGYPPNIKAAPRTVQNSPRLFARFEHRPYTMIAAFFAIGAALGAAAALTSAGDPSDTRSPLSANLQTPDGSSAPSASDPHTGPGSRVVLPPEHSNTVDVSAALPASAPVSLPPEHGANAESTPKPIAPQRMQELDQPSPEPSLQEERKPAAMISGSVAPARAAGHFDRDATAAPVEGSASRIEPSDQQALPEAKPVEAKPKHASHHRGGGVRAQRLRVVPTDQDWAQFWPPEGDDTGRLMFAPRGRGDVWEDRRAPRHHQRRNVAPDGNQGPPRTAREDPMGLVDWVFR